MVKLRVKSTFLSNLHLIQRTSASSICLRIIAMLSLTRSTYLRITTKSSSIGCGSFTRFGMSTGNEMVPGAPLLTDPELILFEQALTAD